MSKSQREETPPTWLDTPLIEKALRKGLKSDSLKILESRIEMATAVGDHYASQMFRFNLVIKTKPDGKEETLSVIAKTLPPGLIGEELKKMYVFEKEEEAYSRILPAINKLLEKAYPDHKKLWADCYYCQGAPESLLLLEDLRPSGFVIDNRFEGLDMEHSVLVLKSLAKFHAASLVLKKENPKSLVLFQKNFWAPEKTNSITNMFTTPFRILSESILDWPDFDKKEAYSKKLKYYEENALNKTFKIWEIDESKMNVLLHGDSWVNNFMFKYDPTGKLMGINFVDFQLTCVNTPALDLQYFIFTSTNMDLRFDFIDLFLKTYHETFEDTLKRLDHRLEVPYTLEDLKKDFEDMYVWGLIVLCTIFPLFVVPKSEVVHPDEFFKNEEGSDFEKTYKREDLRYSLKRGLQFFEEKGIF